MNTASPEKTSAKPGWDLRAWRVGLIFCLIGVGLTAVWTIPYFRDHDIYDYEWADIAAPVGLILTFLVFPPILSGIARRRTFFWAYLPLIAFGLWILIVNSPDLIRMFFSPETIPGDFAINLLEIIGICAAIPFVTAGPVCLFRVFRRRANRKRQAKALAMEEAMHEVREGVWPPPPADQGSGQ
jgi:hypothetical protein